MKPARVPSPLGRGIPVARNIYEMAPEGYHHTTEGHKFLPQRSCSEMALSALVLV